jgi:hypothetical protein
MDFFELVRTGTPQDVQAAIKGGADINARDVDGMTALMYAAQYNSNSEVISVLLKAGADVKTKAEHSETVLMAAAMNNENPEVVMMLLKAGADAKAKDNNGFTAFDYAQVNEKLKGTEAYSKLEESALAARQEQKRIEKEMEERAGRTELGFEGFPWGTHIRDVAREYDEVVRRGGRAPLNGVQRETPDGVNPLIYYSEDKLIHIQFEWDRGTGKLIGGAYIVGDQMMEKLVVRLRLGKPLLVQGGKLWMPSPDTVVTQSLNVLGFHWTATREGQIYEFLYKKAAGIPMFDAWGAK